MTKRKLLKENFKFDRVTRLNELVQTKVLSSAKNAVISRIFQVVA